VVLEAADHGQLTLVSQAAPVAIVADWREFDAKDKVQGLHPRLLAVLNRAAGISPVGFDVIEGVRTLARQRELVARGASKTMNSRHLTGHAADLWPIDPKTGKRAANEDKLLWALLTEIAGHVKVAAKDLGTMIEWGGDWGWDAPHFQLNRKQFP
jgi:peptidoglycan L-alanyl-D-glutamate endopeptidase CwlK